MADVIKGLTGAGSGASTGAAIGSLGGPIGTAIGGAVGGVVGGIAGLFSKPEPSAQELALKKMIAKLEELDLPPTEVLQIAYDRLESQGMLTPEIETAIQQDSTELDRIQTDPEYKDAQRDALARLKAEGDAGGMMLEDRAAVEEALSAAGQQAKGREDAILQNMAERGMGGSGNELAARLSSAQNAANESRDAGLQVASEARRRALESVLGAGNLATDLRTQSFGEQRDVTSAQDAINRFNSSNLQDVLKRNTDRTTDTSVKNLAEKQRLADGNVGISNKEKDQNIKVVADQFDRSFDKITSMGGFVKDQGVAADKNEAQHGAAFGETVKGIGDVANKGVNAYSNYASKKKKEDDDDLSDFLKNADTSKLRA